MHLCILGLASSPRSSCRHCMSLQSGYVTSQTSGFSQSCQQFALSGSSLVPQRLLPSGRPWLSICPCYAMYLTCCTFCYMRTLLCPPAFLQDWEVPYFQGTSALTYSIKIIGIYFREICQDKIHSQRIVYLNICHPFLPSVKYSICIEQVQHKKL